MSRAQREADKKHAAERERMSEEIQRLEARAAKHLAEAQVRDERRHLNATRNAVKLLDSK